MTTAANPFITDLLCMTGILLAFTAAAWPVLRGIANRRTRRDDPSSSAPAHDLASTPQEAGAQSAAIVLAARPYAYRVKTLHDLLIKNYILLDEVNSHRRFRGIPELPDHPLKKCA
jgi:hypothetical protein